MELELRFIGDGGYRSTLTKMASDQGIADRVKFLGWLAAGPAVRAELDRADLFVLPSRTEGLPRALVEAMARGLPCIGSTAGGIPELLQAEDLVPPGNAQALTEKLMEVVRDPGRMSRMAVINWRKSHEFHSDILHAQRRAFSEAVRACAEVHAAER